MFVFRVLGYSKIPKFITKWLGLCRISIIYIFHHFSSMETFPPSDISWRVNPYLASVVTFNVCGVFVNEGNQSMSNRLAAFTLVELVSEQDPLFCGHVPRRTTAEPEQTVYSNGPSSIYFQYLLILIFPSSGPRRDLDNVISTRRPNLHGTPRAK